MTETSTTRLDLAVQQLYENESLTNGCTDDAAQMLLKWGEGELRDVPAADEAAVEGVLQQLQYAMRTINRLIEQRADLSETDLMQRLIKLVEQSMQLANEKSIVQQLRRDNDVETTP